MPRRYHGKLTISLDNGEVVEISVYKNGRSIYLKDSLNEFLVYPSNEGSIDGWVTEYRTVRNISPVSIIEKDFEQAE